ncbi:hypothetical protein [Streptomyces sp. XD-27]|uniref:hypothetical protein n=1 Tax=Streptomyces sp. XD-27 TaxID=3062779 RepID=UPI0026F4269D|nr:hypothetical protein [Streptomyces sp. XD-27]WKX71606.1 hypothetical protein Q3Y56_18285 [Streptomyces sp. XD-27]
MSQSNAPAFASTRPDAHTTWVAGGRIVPTGEDSFEFVPTLWERDDRNSTGWKQVKTAPVPQSYDVRFNDVDASSPRNAILGGDYAEQAGGVVTQRWNGTSWKSAIAPVPRGTQSAGFLSVDTRAPNDAWGAGWTQVRTSEDDSRSVGLLEHWDGNRWKAQKLPDFSEGNGGWSLESVTAVAADDVWAVGGTFNENAAKPLILHYDGTRWSKVPAPDLAAKRAGLTAVVAGPGGQVWAVGEAKQSDGTWQGLALKYDGKKWTNVTLPKGTAGLRAVTISQGAPVVLTKGTDDTSSAVLRRAGDKWVSMKLPAGAQPHNGSDISASGRTIDVTANHEPTGSQWTGPASVLTTRR